MSRRRYDAFIRLRRALIGAPVVNVPVNHRKRQGWTPRIQARHVNRFRSATYTWYHLVVAYQVDFRDLLVNFGERDNMPAAPARNSVARHSRTRTRARMLTDHHQDGAIYCSACRKNADGSPSHRDGGTIHRLLAMTKATDRMHHQLEPVSDHVLC